MKFRFMKKETMITLALIAGILIIVGLNTNVLASTGFSNLTLNTANSAETGNSSDSIEVVNKNTNTNTDAPGTHASAGLEDLPYLVITLLVVSAIFAYKKINEYKSF